MKGLIMDRILRDSLQKVDFENLCNQWGDTPYRLLIQEHLRKAKDSSALLNAVRGITGALTNTEYDAIFELFQHYYNLACTNAFWANSIASQVLKESAEFLSDILQEKGVAKDNRILFAGFQFITLNFAGIASESKDFRKAIGIRKSLFSK